jgi:hypothetical protein
MLLEQGFVREMLHDFTKSRLFCKQRKTKTCDRHAGKHTQPGFLLAKRDYNAKERRSMTAKSIDFRMIYLPGMKNHTRRFLIIGTALLLAVFIAGFARSAVLQSTSSGGNTSAAFFLQATSTPEPQDQSEIGSTDGIVAMGGVIALIIIIPILVRYKYWARPSSQ